MYILFLLTFCFFPVSAAYIHPLKPPVILQVIRYLIHFIHDQFLCYAHKACTLLNILFPAYMFLLHLLLYDIFSISLIFRFLILFNSISVCKMLKPNAHVVIIVSDTHVSNFINTKSLLFFCISKRTL